jgi:glycosyltransferase involved in cell wall biosynthesis/peptidoglycan/xylan/chitin deacetylase (PgdA/CDA1 family)
VTTERTQGNPASNLPRVLVLADHLGYPGGVTHGCTSHFLSILPALRSAGVDLTACFLREPHPAAEQLQKDSIDPIFLSMHPYDPRAVVKVIEIVREDGIDLIHAAGIKATLVARMAAFQTRSKVIIHLHDLIYPGWGLSLLHRCFARSRDWGICVSTAALPVAEHGYHLSPDHIKVVHNGIPVTQFQAAAETTRNIRQELGIAEDRKIIALVGRMYPVKGHARMLHILKLVAQQCPQVLLLVIGDGPEREACERLADAHELRGHVRFLGTRHDVPVLLKASDLLVIPSVSEGLSTVAIEAHAIGKPVVSFAVGGVPEVVTDQVNGRLIDPKDLAGFARAVVELLNDEEKRRALGAEGLRSAERFSIERNVKALVECYQVVMDSQEYSRSLFTGLHAMWRKNVPEFVAWWNRGLPAFVTAWKPEETLGGVPVFCYHLVEGNRFEADLQFLQRNHYHTLSGSEFEQYLLRRWTAPPRSVVLAFDDGPRNFYDVAYPLLCQYQAKAIAFIAPGLHAESGEGDTAEARPMTWKEIEEIHASGLVEFQSHTLESRYVPQWPMPAPLAGCDPLIENARRAAPLPFERDLEASRIVIEARLSGARVSQLAFPMYVGTEEAVTAARKLGFTVCHWGLLPGHPLNCPGDSPFHVSRVSDEFLQRLPGEGRISMLGMLRERIQRIRYGRYWRQRYGQLMIRPISHA